MALLNFRFSVLFSLIPFYIRLVARLCSMASLTITTDIQSVRQICEP
jgi:hypothetical protein